MGGLGREGGWEGRRKDRQWKVLGGLEVVRLFPALMPQLTPPRGSEHL